MSVVQVMCKGNGHTHLGTFVLISKYTCTCIIKTDFHVVSVICMVSLENQNN